MYLICYDISTNSLRARLADLLLANGFERLQKSIFIGLDNPASITNIVKVLNHLRKEEEEQVLILKITENQVERMKVFGKFTFDKDYLLGKKRSLIF